MHPDPTRPGHRPRTPAAPAAALHLRPRHLGRLLSRLRPRARPQPRPGGRRTRRGAAPLPHLPTRDADAPLPSDDGDSTTGPAPRIASRLQAQLDVLVAWLAANGLDDQEPA